MHRHTNMIQLLHKGSDARPPPSQFLKGYWQVKSLKKTDQPSVRSTVFDQNTRHGVNPAWHPRRIQFHQSVVTTWEEKWKQTWQHWEQLVCFIRLFPIPIQVCLFFILLSYSLLHLFKHHFFCFSISYSYQSLSYCYSSNTYWCFSIFYSYLNISSYGVITTFTYFLIELSLHCCILSPAQT